MAGRLARRAALAAQLEYSPQVSALLTLMEQAGADNRQQVRATRVAARGIARSAKLAAPMVRGAYDDAAATVDTQRSALATALAGLGSSADPFKAAAATEASGYATRQAGERARALTELADRRVEAHTGAAYQQRALAADLAKTRSQIGGQLQDLTAQQGAATRKNLLDLLDDAANRRLSRDRINATLRGQDETARHNRATEQTAAAKLRGRGGVRPLTTNQQNAVFQKLEQARGWVKRLTASNGTGQVREMLRTGTTLHVPMLDPTADQSGDPVYLKDSHGQVKTQTVTVPSFAHELVNSAFDLETLGYLSRPNVRALHNAGLRIGHRYRYVKGPRRPLPPGISGPPAPNLG